MPVDGAAALSDISECLRHLACGYGLDPRERAACLCFLEAGLPGIGPGELQTVQKILVASRRRARPATREGQRTVHPAQGNG